MSVTTKDILLKAAEDVQSGMWCKGAHFQEDGQSRYCFELWDRAFGLTLDDALASKRCAEGSLAVATKLLGGSHQDYVSTVCKVDLHVGESLFVYNDTKLPDDPFEAGQQLAELFRSAAESL